MSSDTSITKMKDAELSESEIADREIEFQACVNQFKIATGVENSATLRCVALRDSQT